MSPPEASPPESAPTADLQAEYLRYLQAVLLQHGGPHAPGILTRLLALREQQVRERVLAIRAVVTTSSPMLIRHELTRLLEGLGA